MSFLSKETAICRGASDMWIERTVEHRLSERADQTPVIILVGPRGTGKRELTRRLFPNWTHVPLDRSDVVLRVSGDPAEFLQELPAPCILDHLQYAPFLLGGIDASLRGSCRWIFTCTYLTNEMERELNRLGPAAEVIRLSTISAEELRSTWISSRQRTAYCWRGGYPALWEDSNARISRFFDDYLHTFIERDLRSLVQVKHELEFHRFLRLCAQSAGEMVNYAHLARHTKVSANTVKAWIKALERTGVICLLPSCSGLIPRRIIKAPKLYFHDPGMLCSLLGINGSTSLEQHPRYHFIWNHIVFGELWKSLRWEPGLSLFCYRDQNGVELDFILMKGRKVTLIQGAVESLSPERRSAFRTAGRAFRRTQRTYLAATPDTDMRGDHEEGYSCINPLYQTL